MSQNKIKKYIVQIGEFEFLAKLAHSPVSKAIIEKRGFTTKEKANEWVDKELIYFTQVMLPDVSAMQNITNENSHYQKMSFLELSQIIEKDLSNRDALNMLGGKSQKLREDMIRDLMMERKMSEQDIVSQVNNMIGIGWKQLYLNSKNNTLDALASLQEEKNNERQKLSPLVSTGNDVNWPGSEASRYILGLIKSIPGVKVITLNVNFDVDIVDIHANGTVGYAKEHENLILQKIDMAFRNPNSFLIRQLIPNSEEEVVINGKNKKIPWNAMYGFILQGKGIVCIPAEEVEHFCTIDKDNLLVQSEDMVIYKDFSDLLQIQK